MSTTTPLDALSQVGAANDKRVAAIGAATRAREVAKQIYEAELLMARDSHSDANLEFTREIRKIHQSSGVSIAQLMKSIGRTYSSFRRLELRGETQERPLDL